MPSDKQCEECEPWLAAYALGDRDRDTVRQVETCLASCPEARKTLAAYQAVANMLPLGVPDALPAPELRARLLTQVATGERPQEPAVRRLRKSRPVFWRRMLLVINTIALIALLVWNVSLQQALQQRAARGQAAWAMVSQALNRPEVQQFHLTPDHAPPSASGVLLLAPGEAEGCLLVAGMPQLASDQVYQLWLLTDGQRTSGGTFQVDPAGNGWLLVEQSVPLDSFTALGITVEPAGGSVGPTSARIIGGSL